MVGDVNELCSIMSLWMIKGYRQHRIYFSRHKPTTGLFYLTRKSLDTYKFCGELLVDRFVVQHSSSASRTPKMPTNHLPQSHSEEAR